MPAPRPLAWVKPWMVAASLTVVAAVGATTVYFVGEAQHRRDREDIRAWETAAAPVIADAISFEQLVATEGEPVVRARVLADRQRLLSGRIPDVVRPTVRDYVAAIDKALAALDVYGSAKFDAAARAAAVAFSQAEMAKRDLECNAGLCPKALVSASQINH